MNCPLCIDQTLAVTHRHDIELDICPKCHGIWLDRGEIDRLLGEDEPTAPSQSRPLSDDRGQEQRERDQRRQTEPERSKKKSKKKKKSLAERIGDAIEDAIDELT